MNSPHSSPDVVNRTSSDLPDGAVIRAVTSPPCSGSPPRSITLACRASVWSSLRLVGHVVQPHRLALGHVALVGHPAHHLAPEPIVILVLDPLAPPPGAVGAHEEDLAGPEGPRDQQRQPAELVGLRPCARPGTSVPALARSTGAYHWKPGSPSQTSAFSSSVSASLVSRLRRPVSVSSKWLGVREPQPPGCGVVEHHRAEVAQLGIQQRELAAPASPA